MATTKREKLPKIKELSAAEGQALFDQQARRYTGMSGATFARKWAAGEIPEPDRTDVLRVAMLLPLARTANGRE